MTRIIHFKIPSLENSGITTRNAYSLSPDMAKEIANMIKKHWRNRREKIGWF